MAQTKVALNQVYNYEIITRTEDVIENVESITEDSQIEITEGDSFRLRITKDGSDTTRFGGATYWHIYSDSDYSSVWKDQAIVYAPWSYWNDGDSYNISEGLYLPSQDSVNWEIASNTDGAPGLGFKEDWDENLIHPPSIEFTINTVDDATYKGDLELDVRFSLSKDEIVTDSTTFHTSEGETQTIPQKLTSKNLKIIIKENDGLEDDLVITGPSGIAGDISGYASITENKNLYLTLNQTKKQLVYRRR